MPKQATLRNKQLFERCEQLGIDTSMPFDMASRMPADDQTLQERLRAYEHHQREGRLVQFTLVSSIAALISSIAALAVALGR